MSRRAVQWALGHSTAEGALRLVLVVLAANSDTDGEGQIRPHLIAKQAAIPQEHVETALRALTASDRITYTQIRRRRIYRYRVFVPEDYYPQPNGNAHQDGLTPAAAPR